MRVIVEVLGRSWMFTLQSAKIVIASEPAEEDEEFKRAPVDPHSVGGCVIEHSDEQPLEVQKFSGAGVYPWPDEKRRFGFRGSESPGPAQGQG